ncbi:MAG: DNA phosphorothioation system sulfurtransferase DndC, partial [Ekhidna sp.]|nr:DNA phosphorothioation system sulfurtransferase DndC [Ekhidna sp.]
VKRDKSMEALIENGEEWMEPLMNLRDMLAVSRDDKEAREERRRDGTKKEGQLGPYKPAFRANFLELLLEAQRQIQADQPDINLINYQELVAIQVLWHRDNIFNYNVADIYANILGRKMENTHESHQVIEEKEMLLKSCNCDQERFELINELLSLQKSKTILMKKRGLQNDLENRIDQFVNQRKNVSK